MSKRIPKYHELSRLPTPPRYKSLRFRQQVPGKVESAIMSQRQVFIDQSHPIAKASYKLPNFHHPAFRVSAFPMAMLGRSDYSGTAQEFDTWNARVKRFLEEMETGKGVAANKEEREGTEEVEGIGEVKTAEEVEISGHTLALPPMKLANQKAHQFPMSFACVASIKKTSSKKHIREKLRRKLQTALTLIIVRGADVCKSNKMEHCLTFRDKDVLRSGGQQWVLRGWTYVFWPTLEIYRMSYYELIPILRGALESVMHMGAKLEEKWEQAALKEVTKKSPAETTASIPTSNNDKSDQKVKKPEAEWLGWFRNMAEKYPTREPQAGHPEDLDYDQLMKRHSADSGLSKGKTVTLPEPPKRYTDMLFKPKPKVMLGPSSGKNRTDRR